MKLYIYSILALLTFSLVEASRSDFYGENDNRPELFKILDDHVGTIKLSLDKELWANIKNMTVLAPWGATEAERFITNEATLDFFVEGTDYKAHLEPGEFTFKAGGSGSRNYVKPGYNIKLEKGSIYEVKSIRLRGNIRDPTLMREKLSSDMFYKMGIPATSANYVNVEVNGEDLGIYIITNKIKKDFIKRYYGEKGTSTLYECKDAGSRFEDNSIAERCMNLEEELIDYKDDIRAFNDAINNATSVEEIEEVLDVDEFLRVAAFELLTVSWDHFISYSHNNFWYKREDGKWVVLLKDYDETFAQNFCRFIFDYFTKYADKNYVPKDDELNIANISIRDLDQDHKFLKYLIHDDDTRFRNIIGEIVKEVFNPKVLFSRIDELSELIRDEIKHSRTLDENGFCKGCINTLGFNPKWNITHFDEASNYVSWNSNKSNTVSFGLKYFIEERFRYICHTYGIDPETLELIEPRPKVSFWGIKNEYKASFTGNDFFKDEFVRYTYPDLDKEDYMQESYNADPEKNDKPTNYVIPPFRYEQEVDPIVPVKTEEEKIFTIIPNEEEETSTVIPGKEEEECWSESYGYPCCESSCHIYETDAKGKWGYENHHWCGIPSSCNEDKCWSSKYGYPCCTSCIVYDTDENSEWGYENHHWCGIPSTCNESKCWSEKYGYPCCISSCHVYETDDNGEWGYEDHHWCGITEEICKK